jgi:1-phosphofructokinase
MIYTLTLNPAVDHTIYVDEINNKDVTRVKKTIKDGAGKGINVSKVLRTLHVDSICLGFIAGDNGRYIKNELAKRDIPIGFIEVNGETRENIKLIITHENKVIELNEVGPKINSSNKKELIMKLDNLLKKDDILVISGSVPEGIEKTMYADIVDRYKDVFTILDVSGELFTYGVQGLPNVIKPNLYELEQYANKSLKSDNAVIEVCKKLVEQGIEHVVVTLGSKGALYVSAEHVYKVEIPTVQAKSTVGAGDSFVAGLVYGFHHHFSVDKLLQYAAAVASASVKSEGTAKVDPEDINELFYLTKVKEI